MYTALPDIPEAAPIKAALRGHWKKWLADSEVAAASRLSVRMTKAGLDTYRQHLDKAVTLAALYDDAGADRQASAVYLIDADIYNIYSGTRKYRGR